MKGSVDQRSAVPYAKSALRVAAVLVPVAILSGIAGTTVETLSRRVAYDFSHIQYYTNTQREIYDLWGSNGKSLENAAQDLSKTVENAAHDTGETVDAKGAVEEHDAKAVLQEHQVDPVDDTVTLKLTKAQATALLQVLQNTLSDAQPGGSQQDTAAAVTFNTTHDSSPSRLVNAIPLLLIFVVSASLIVLLMVFAGVMLMRTGLASGGAKMEFMGMKIDAKGGGIASIACGAFVFLATFRPLISAVVTLSQH